MLHGTIACIALELQCLLTWQQMLLNIAIHIVAILAVATDPAIVSPYRHHTSTVCILRVSLLHAKEGLRAILLKWLPMTIGVLGRASRDVET